MRAASHRGAQLHPRRPLFAIDIERRSLPHYGFAPDSTALLHHGLACEGEPETRAWKLGRWMQTFEGGENLVQILRLDANAIVADQDDTTTVLDLTGDFNARHPGLVINHSIDDQILDHLDHQRLVVSDF